MIRSLIVLIILLLGSAALSYFYVGYSRAGVQYISKHREMRKSIRGGSVYHYGGYGQKGFRGGK